MSSHPVIEALQPCLERGHADVRLVVELGRAFQAQSLPSGFRINKPKECFVNAANAAFKRRGVYVEGFALSPMTGVPIHHAWITQDGRNALDVTWTTIGESYYGIAIPTAFLVQHAVVEHNGRPSILAHANDSEMVKRLRQAINADACTVISAFVRDDVL